MSTPGIRKQGFPSSHRASNATRGRQGSAEQPVEQPQLLNLPSSIISGAGTPTQVFENKSPTVVKNERIIPDMFFAPNNLAHQIFNPSMTQKL